MQRFLTDVVAACHQPLHNFKLAVEVVCRVRRGSQHQRCVAVAVGFINIASILCEELHNFQMAHLCCSKKGGVARLLHFLQRGWPEKLEHPLDKVKVIVSAHESIWLIGSRYATEMQLEEGDSPGGQQNGGETKLVLVLDLGRKGVQELQDLQRTA